VYNLQEFAPASLTVGTPEPINFKITGVNFNLADPVHFTVNITNVASSTDAIIPAQISLNGNNASFLSQTIPIGETRQFNCTFDWSGLRGMTVTGNVSIANGQYLSGSITVPSVDLTISDTVGFNTTSEGLTYVSITISNSAFSIQDATIANIIFATSNSTDYVNETIPKLLLNGYLLPINTEVTLVCPWYWKNYYGQALTITVNTVEGLTVTKTLPIPARTP
jgi:hypothetical protein